MLAVLFHSLETVKGSVGQMDKLEEKNEWLLTGMIHLHMATTLFYMTGLNLGTRFIISVTQTECDS